MRKGRRSTAPRAPRKPTDAAAGVPHVRKFMVKLFDREDGKAADWPLIAETLLREAFHALDQSPNDPRVLALLRRVNAGTYDRLTGNPPEIMTRYSAHKLRLRIPRVCSLRSRVTTKGQDRWTATSFRVAGAGCLWTFSALLPAHLRQIHPRRQSSAPQIRLRSMSYFKPSSTCIR